LEQNKEIDMETMKALITRRSIRCYEPKAVPTDVITALLRAAMQAPSAMNQQPWRFVVIDERATLDRIAVVHPYAEMTALAPLAVVVCADTTALKAPNHWPQDCSAATENLLLAAHDAGLGAVWSAVYPDEAQVTIFRNLLGLPVNVIPHALVPIGYPAENKEPEDRYDPEHVHHNRW
jgi:nitroreductase